MKNIEGLTWVGRLLGVVGLVVCAVSGLARLAGRYTLNGFPVITLFQAGIALLVAGCFFLLLVLASRSLTSSTSSRPRDG